MFKYFIDFSDTLYVSNNKLFRLAGTDDRELLWNQNCFSLKAVQLFLQNYYIYKFFKAGFVFKLLGTLFVLKALCNQNNIPLLHKKEFLDLFFK